MLLRGGSSKVVSVGKLAGSNQQLVAKQIANRWHPHQCNIRRRQLAIAGVKNINVEFERNPTREEYVLIFASSVRQYNKVKARLLPFLEAFYEEHGYTPRREDVEAEAMTTRNPQLLQDFVKFHILRSRVLIEIRQLRAKLQELETGEFKFKRKRSKKKKIGGVNINDDPITATELAMKYIAAMDYRRRREAQKTRQAMMRVLGKTESEIAEDETNETQLDNQSTEAVVREDLPARVRAAYLKAETYKQNGTPISTQPTSKPKLAKFTEAAMAREIALKDKVEVQTVLGNTAELDKRAARVTGEEKGEGLPTMEGASSAALLAAGPSNSVLGPIPKPTLKDFLKQSHDRELARKNDPAARAQVLQGDTSAFTSRVTGEDAREGLPLAEGDPMAKAAALSKQARLAGRNATRAVMSQGTTEAGKLLGSEQRAAAKQKLRAGGGKWGLGIPGEELVLGNGKLDLPAEMRKRTAKIYSGNPEALYSSSRERLAKRAADSDETVAVPLPNGANHAVAAAQGSDEDKAGEEEDDKLAVMSDEELQEHEESLRAVLLETLQAAEESIVVNQ